MMIDLKYITLLDTLKFKNSFHSSRNLLTHLKGTYTVLSDWGNPQEICLAGLFHSIYGTSSFKKKSINLDKRVMVQDIIGVDSEELVYLFCVTNRKFLQQIDNENMELYNRITDENVKISNEILKSLIEIEAANLIEQFPHLFFGKKRALKYIDRISQEAKNHLSNPAQKELKKIVDQYRNKRLFF
ncbi:hypothetical protein IRZ71_24710 [Flavobacterium sp. ANB]|uniref:DUF6817 domain-containing protein n=1 Tax=unclassified Flavobacterium TaxID=196869 RepID=UPI0012B93E7B|nr:MULTISPECIES: hypothetical protein [unclassified Flavobacterium]MBF4519552.1 hypothetical protein [Flavobacterium sp. ANB]MTD72520.1 hypothetical protein [Flavobacterium sp. LC2016-13]